MSADLRQKAQTAAVKVTGKRFCSNHQGYSDASGGTFRKSGRIVRWICANCSKPKTIVAALNNSKVVNQKG